MRSPSGRRLAQRRGAGAVALPAEIRDAAHLAAVLGPTGNDLEAAALALAPQVGEALYALKAQPGALTARMSGSGATCFALFAAAAEVGAMAAGADAAKVKALADYGRAIGVAFQLVDDALDYAASADTIGKNAGDDFREGKITLPVILAFARGASDERAFWTRVIADDKQRPEDFDAAVDLIKLRDAIEDTLARAQSYALAAKDALQPFEDGPYKRALSALADFCVERAY